MNRTPERQAFLTDVLTNYVEGHPYSWFDVRDYEWFQPGLSGGTAKPAIIDGKPAPNVTGTIRVSDPEKDEGHFMPWRKLTPALAERGFARLAEGPIEGLSEECRARLLGASAIHDSGLLDVNDDDIVLQVAMLGSVVYA